MCELFKVSKSSYYRFFSKKKGKRELQNEIILNEIYKIKNDEITNFSKCYGQRAVTTVLKQKEKELGFLINHKRISRIMRENSLNSIVRAKKIHKKKLTTKQFFEENIINRDFSTSKINEKVFTDITEINTNLGKFYLSAIIDPHDNCILAPSISKRQNKKLVLKTLQTFVKQENILPKQTILHTDRGTQYTSLKYKRTLDFFGITHSMSRPGKCPDNSPIESFWATFKEETFKVGNYQFKEEQEVINYILSYIDFYNNDRVRSINKKVNRQIRYNTKKEGA